MRPIADTGIEIVSRDTCTIIVVITLHHVLFALCRPRTNNATVTCALSPGYTTRQALNRDMARSKDAAVHLQALLTALDAGQLAQADAASTRLCRSTDTNRVTPADFARLLHHVAQPQSERAYVAAAHVACTLVYTGSTGVWAASVVPHAAAAALARALCAPDPLLAKRAALGLTIVLSAMPNNEARILLQTAIAQVGTSICPPPLCCIHTQSLWRTAGWRAFVPPALVCAAPTNSGHGNGASCHCSTKRRRPTAPQVPGVVAAMGRLLGGDAIERGCAATILHLLLRAAGSGTDIAATAAVAAAQPGALLGLIAATTERPHALSAMTCWSCLSGVGNVPFEDLARAVRDAARRGVLWRALEAAAQLIVRGNDNEFGGAAEWLVLMCEHEAAREEVAAHAGVLSALRGSLRGARALPVLELLIMLLRSVWPQAGGEPAVSGGALRRACGNSGAAADRECESSGSRVSSSGGSGDTGVGIGGLGDPGLLSEVVRAAGGPDLRVSRAALYYLRTAAGPEIDVWALPLMAPIAVATLRKGDNMSTA
jgi:hypothetical protein